MADASASVQQHQGTHVAQPPEIQGGRTRGGAKVAVGQRRIPAQVGLGQVPEQIFRTGNPAEADFTAVDLCDGTGTDEICAVNARACDDDLFQIGLFCSRAFCRHKGSSAGQCEHDLNSSRQAFRSCGHLSPGVKAEPDQRLYLAWQQSGYSQCWFAEDRGRPRGRKRNC